MRIEDTDLYEVTATVVVTKRTYMRIPKDFKDEDNYPQFGLSRLVAQNIQYDSVHWEFEELEEYLDPQSVELTLVDINEVDELDSSDTFAFIPKCTPGDIEKLDPYEIKCIVKQHYDWE
jgi:Glu-tRNA(Gln) amidotransferase subunit E-like FAD-binding protein